MRAEFLPGKFLKISEFGFSHTTPNGTEFATKYVKQTEFVTYTSAVEGEGNWGGKEGENDDDDLEDFFGPLSKYSNLLNSIFIFVSIRVFLRRDRCKTILETNIQIFDFCKICATLP